MGRAAVVALSLVAPAAAQAQGLDDSPNVERIRRAATQGYAPKPSDYGVKFNLRDAELTELVNHISGMTGKRFIYGPKVKKLKVTVVSPTPVTLDEAYGAFLSILAAHGMTVVPHGRFLKIVTTGGVVTKGTPLYPVGAPVPASDRFLTRLYRMKSASAHEAATLLARFKSKDGDISVHAPRLVIITDTGSQIRRLVRIAEEIDAPGARSKMWVHPVHHVAAERLAKRIRELFPLPKPDTPAEGGLVKVVADAPSNSLVVVGTEDSYLKLLELVKHLDSQPAADGKIHVLPLQHANAEELAATLKSTVKGRSRKKGRRGRKSRAGTSSVFEGAIELTPEAATNSLIITASPRDYAELRLAIDRLDKPRRQVFIEAVVMDLSIDRSDRLGLNYHAGATASLGAGDDSLVYGGLSPLNTILPPDAEQLQGLALGVRGASLEGSSELLGIGVSVPAFGVTLNALASSGNANVLATPHILATDNVTAEIAVGENIPLQENIAGARIAAGTRQSPAGRTGAKGANPLAALAGLSRVTPRQDVGTKIKVTPHINESNQVRLEIEEEISERGASSGSVGAVSITQRTATTTLVVGDQQTVVIGGLMRDHLVRTKERIPVLGHLPVLGFLFRSSTTEKRKTNLLLILTPHVVHDESDLRRIFQRKIRERQEFLDRYFVLDGDTWEPPRHYTYTNGLVEDIRRTHRELAERARLEAARAEEQARQHTPQVGTELPKVAKSRSTAKKPKKSPKRRRKRPRRKRRRGKRRRK